MIELEEKRSLFDKFNILLYLFAISFNGYKLVKSILTNSLNNAITYGGFFCLMIWFLLSQDHLIKNKNLKKIGYIFRWASFLIFSIGLITIFMYPNTFYK